MEQEPARALVQELGQALVQALGPALVQGPARALKLGPARALELGQVRAMALELGQVRAMGPAPAPVPVRGLGPAAARRCFLRRWARATVLNFHETKGENVENVVAKFRLHSAECHWRFTYRTNLGGCNVMVRVQRFGVREMSSAIGTQTVSSLTTLSGGDGCIVERNEYVQRNPTSKRGVRGCSLNETARRFDGHSSWHRVASNTR
jgi:hypothetical protein